MSHGVRQLLSHWSVARLIRSQTRFASLRAVLVCFRMERVFGATLSLKWTNRHPSFVTPGGEPQWALLIAS
jgi:hypothetical protein